MKDILVVKNPFPTTRCEMKKCLLCTNDSNQIKVPCNSNNVGYRLICETCRERGLNKIYEGETARSARLRGGEHLKDLEKRREKSVLLKHKLSDHPTENVKFTMEITKKFKDALTRQANEAVRIFSRPGHEILNSKSEFNHPPLGRVVVEKKRKNRT